MSVTQTALTPYIGYACPHCGYYTRKNETCSNCGVPVQLNLNLPEFISMLDTTYLDIKSRQLRIGNIIEKGFQSADVTLKEFLLETSIISIMEQLRTEIIPEFRDNCQSMMETYLELKTQGKNLLNHLNHIMEKLRVNIKEYKLPPNPVSTNLIEYDSLLPKFSNILRRIKKYKSSEIPSLLSITFNQLKPLISLAHRNLHILKNGLADVSSICNIFNQFNAEYQERTENFLLQDLKTSDIYGLSSLECQLAEFRTIFQVRDSLCKIPWENGQKLTSRKLKNALLKIWDVICVILSAGGMK